MTQPVEALYVPKSIKYERDGDGYRITIKAVSFGKALIGAILIFLAVFSLPIMFLAKSGGPIVLIMLVGGIFLLRSSGPPMHIGPTGVEVNGRLYRAEDASHFTNHADDGWLTQFLPILKASPLGLQYGIYSVHMPYVLSHNELAKVAVFLTDLLKAQSPQLEAERTRKIQQAQSF